MARKMSIGFSEWHYRAQECIAQGALTNSKRPDCLVKGVYPTHIRNGTGCWLFDDKGKQYADFICGLGTNLLGYGQTQVAQAIAAQAAHGACFSLGSTHEVLAAEKLKEMFPFVERVKFLKSGSEACSAAIRIARAATGRTRVFSEGYHGWHDDFVSLTPPAAGVPRRECINKLSDFEQIDVNTAAVIVEPVMTDSGITRRMWLKALRDRCDKVGALLIFDEVITGFRFPKWSVASAWGITPDLICLGKAMANGMPLAAVCGKKSVMDNPAYFVSSTYAGETLSLAAALTTMTLLQKTFNVDRLWEQGEAFITKFNTISPNQKVKLKGYATRAVFEGEPLAKALFWQEACIAGILFGPSWFFNFSHLEIADWVLSTCRDIMVRLDTGEIKLLGELPQAAFAQKARES
jgi:glutamate-1-semialdehyde aminotransferase